MQKTPLGCLLRGLAVAAEPVGAKLAREEAITFNIYVDCHTAVASKLCSYKGVAMPSTSAFFQRVNKRCNDFDGAVVQHVGRWLGQRLGTLDHFEGGPVQIGVAGAAHQFKRQHITSGIDHETQTVQPFLAPRLST